jgi:hypothetical protein
MSYPLDVIRVEQPCPADWEAMVGDDRRRYCAGCRKHVHDLTRLTAAEAERLVCASAGSLCIRMARDEAGKLITLDYAPTTAVKAWWMRWKFLAPLTAVLATLGGWVSVRSTARPAIPTMGAVMVVGDMSPLPPRVAPPPPPRVVMGEIAPARQVERPAACD